MHDAVGAPVWSVFGSVGTEPAGAEVSAGAEVAAVAVFVCCVGWEG